MVLSRWSITCQWVGSLYPGRDEVADATGRWVLPVEMKVPGSITLSLPVMAAAKEVVRHTHARTHAPTHPRALSLALSMPRGSCLQTSSREGCPALAPPLCVWRSLPSPSPYQVVIAACGVSDKYPKGKSAAMARGIEGDETPQTFPAVGLRGVATWVVDAAAASTLSFEYAECFALASSRGDCCPPA